MAYDTTDTEDQVDTQVPPEVVTALKQANPAFTDSMIAQGWQQAVQSNPALAKSDPSAFAQNVIKAFETTKAGGTPNQVGNAPGGSSPPTVTNTPTSAPQTAPTDIPAAPTSPFEGAGYTQADLMRNYNPEQVKKAFDTTGLQNAYAEQQALYQKNLPTRIQSAGLAASGTANMSAANKDQWDSIDAQNMLQTIGKQATLLGISKDQQVALERAATAGLAAGKTAVDIGNEVQKGFGLFGDNVVKSLNVQQQQRFNDPNSTETQSAKAAILAQISTLSPEAKAALTPIINKPGVTAQQLMPLMAQYVPAAFKAFTDAAGIGKTVAETAKTSAETAGITQAQGIVAQNQGTPPPPAYNPAGGVKPVTGGSSDSQQPAKFNFSPGTDMKAVRAVMARSPDVKPADLAAFDKQFPEASVGAAPTVTTPMATNAQVGDKLKAQAAGPTPAELEATKAQMRGKAPNFAPITEALNEGRVSPDETSPTKIAEADTNKLSDVQLLQKKALESTDPQEIIQLHKNIAQLTGKPYKSPVPLNINQVEGQGGVHLAQSGLSQANQQHTSNDIAATNAQLGQFANGGKQAATQVLLNADQAGPKFDNMATAGNPKAEALRNGINKLNQDATNLGLVAGGDNSSGALLSGAGAAAAAAAPGGLAKAGGVALSALGGMLGNGQAITTRSDPKTVAAMSIAVQEVAAKKAMLLAQQQAYADAHNGDGMGFVNTPVYQHIVQSKPLVNPQTGEVRVPVTNDQRIALKKSGFGDAQTFLGNK